MNRFKAYYALRWQILERDNFTCQYCGQHAPNVQLEVDHLIPREEGGDDNPKNLRTSCYACNRGKSGLHIIIKRKGKVNNLHTPRTPAKDKLWELLTSETKEITPRYIAEKLDITIANARVVISRAVKSGLLKRVKFGRYQKV